MICVVEYDPAWPQAFEQLRKNLLRAVDDVALTIEHVGSTAVPGLAGKPIIDFDIVVASSRAIPVVIERLAGLGYIHRGDLGIEGREAFASPADSVAHHAYVCVRGSLPLENHLTLRDYLRAHPKAVLEYGALKKELAKQFSSDSAAYVQGKTDFILTILRSADFPDAKLKAIERANRPTAV